MERDEYDGVNKAQTLINLFAGRFRRITYTRHPSGVAGEIKGRSSIVSWAAKEVMRYHQSSSIWSAAVLVTVVDGKCCGHICNICAVTDARSQLILISCRLTFKRLMRCARTIPSTLLRRYTSRLSPSSTTAAVSRDWLDWRMYCARVELSRAITGGLWSRSQPRSTRYRCPLSNMSTAGTLV